MSGSYQMYSTYTRAGRTAIWTITASILASLEIWVKKKIV